MVLGIDTFREKFRKYTDYYTIIGGTACDILLTEADMSFRATKDIDLFSRKPGYHLELEAGIIPVHIDDNTSSLSAILLNDDFYQFMMTGRRVIDGIGVLGAEYLIPFKMYAWINLLDRKRAGEHVNEKDLRKHKYDVFRLLQIVTADSKIESTGLVNESIHKFIDEISSIDESEVRLVQMGLPFDRAQGVRLLKEIYF